MIAQKIQLKVRSKELKDYLDKRIEFARRVWNSMLNHHNELYAQYKQLPEEQQNDRSVKKQYCPSTWDLRDWQKQQIVPGFEDCTNMIIEMEAEFLGQAFKGFYDKKRGYPKFKKSCNSFTIHWKNKTTCRVDENNKLHLDKHHWIKLTESVKYTEPAMYTFSKEADRYYVSITFKDDAPIYETTNIDCGIDMGLKTAVSLADSAGNYRTYAPNYIQLEKDYKRADDYTRLLSRKKKGSKSYNRTKLKRQRQYRKIKNKQDDFNKKVTSKIIKDYDNIGIEDLNIAGMMKNRKLGHSLQTKAMGSFITCLKQKAATPGRTVTEIGRFYPSSQVCSHCGQVHAEMKNLSKRVMICDCGCSLDRDLNAAKNILMESQRIRAEK